MYVYHATHKDNVPSIQRRGLLLSMAKCSPAAIWFGHPAVRLAAVRHAAKRHGWHLREMVLFRADLRKECLTRHGGTLWCFSTADVSLWALAAPISCEGIENAR